jgi:2-polyprenyl-3-methyl-5-hydroxy-6-metoxy-1,4-benzoquinol methylase
MRCFFCASPRVRRAYAGLFHAEKHDHGPFDFYECLACGSGLTLPPPSLESLRALYGSFDAGISGDLRRYLSDDPQTHWYTQCLDRAMRIAGKQRHDRFVWFDVAAGGGELSLLVSTLCPNATGVALDLHRRPATLGEADNVRWIQCDVHERNFARHLQGTGDLVFGIAVWEHVPRPDWFAEDIARLAAPAGTLYMATPDYSSPMRKLLRRQWPYFMPGEHLCMPSIAGAAQALRRVVSARGTDDRVFVNRVSLPYTLRYVMHYLRLDGIGRMLPAGWRLPVPGGALEAGFAPAPV